MESRNHKAGGIFNDFCNDFLEAFLRYILNNIYISHWRRAATPTFAAFTSPFRHQIATQHDGGPPPAARRRAGLRTVGEKAM